MGEFTTGSGDTHNPENVAMGGEQTETEEVPSGYETDVNDLRSDDIVRQGTDEFPCFDVDQNDFYQNMQSGRKRIRFKTGTGAQQYMSKTKYNRSFYIRHTDGKGKQFVRKIK